MREQIAVAVDIEKHQEHLENSQKILKETEKKIKHLEWELEDMKNNSNAKISELTEENIKVRFPLFDNQTQVLSIKKHLKKCQNTWKSRLKIY